MKLSELLIATHNPGKAKEIAALLSPLGIHVTFSGALGLPEPEETGSSFEANALLKAETAAKLSDLPALADDSGLCVAALDGAPGIYSARWAGEKKDFSTAMARVKRELEAKGLDAQGQPAAFVCVLAVALPERAVAEFWECLPSAGRAERAGTRTFYFEGRIEGTLTFPPRGAHGFGYDPIFVPHSHTLTFGEMDPAAKHAISHRARAFEKFREWLQTR